MSFDRMALVLHEVMNERIRQDTRWGDQSHPDGTGGNVMEKGVAHGRSSFGMNADAARNYATYAAEFGVLTWADILREEFYEALAESDQDKLRAELVQVAAVAVAWIEAIDRRGE